MEGGANGKYGEASSLRLDRCLTTLGGSRESRLGEASNIHQQHNPGPLGRTYVSQGAGCTKIKSRTGPRAIVAIDWTKYASRERCRVAQA
ncbi:hypothetical protein CKAH01_10857 [Colletotrichum kahawae]|uniref:Uncharacterized protein n=1 Tax=Colletotrichum kahawae TaxID=34407 RepID=A0AAE0CYA9_COLKA|nr:hypothetical protein CKAH01_10857 [Colletotrichum kahawae]